MRLSILSLALVLPAAAFAGETWPQFRGPTADGHAGAIGASLTWSETENIVWKTAIHDRGWSSPLVWKDQVWITTATEDGRRFFAVAVDRESGRIVHDVHVLDCGQPDPIAAVNSYASPTGVLEEGRFYAHYGTYGTACLDTASGAVLWKRQDLRCDHHEGPGASAIVYDDLLIFHVDGRDVQYVAALNKATGKTVWKTNRSIDYRPFHINLRKAFCTPIVIEADGRKQLISPGAKAVMGYDPRSGEELWKIRYNGWSVAPRPLFGHGLVYLITDYERPELWAIRPGGRGDLTETNVVWKIRQGMPSQPGFLLVGDRLYLVNNDGLATCVDAKTGKIVWKDRMGGSYSASPLYVDGRMLFFSRQSAATALEPGPEFKALGVNRLDGDMMASPAAAGRSLFLRTATHLYRIGK